MGGLVSLLWYKIPEDNRSPKNSNPIAFIDEHYSPQKVAQEFQSEYSTRISSSSNLHAASAPASTSKRRPRRPHTEIQDH